MRALVLSGGGGYGAWQVGGLSHLLGTLGRQHEIVRGVSVGAINGALVAMHPLDEGAKAVDTLEEMWRSLKTKDVVSPRFAQPISLLWNPSTHSTDPLHDLLMDRIDMEKLRNSGRDYGAVAVDIVSGDFQVYGPECPKPQFVPGILGSAATPIMHPDIRAGKNVLYDGGIRDVSPIRQAISAGADEIDLVLCQSPKLSKWNPEPDRVWNTALRVFEIMFRELVENDLDRVDLYNALVEAEHPRGKGKRVVKMRIFRPEEPLPGDEARFDPEQSARLIDMGRKYAESQDWDATG